MKTLIIILILLSFLQATLIPLDLVLMVLILRAYLVTEKANLYLGFGFGFLLSILSNTILGLHSLILVILIEATHLLKKTPISDNYLVVIPLILITSIIYTAFLSLILQQQLILWPKVAAEAILALPVFLGLKFWEERFVVKEKIKLKL